jgi:hypothetical protein
MVKGDGAQSTFGIPYRATTHIQNTKSKNPGVRAMKKITEQKQLRYDLMTEGAGKFATQQLGFLVI